MYLYIVFNYIFITVALCLKLVSVDRLIQDNINRKQEYTRLKEQQEIQDYIRENRYIKEISYIYLESSYNRESIIPYKIYKEKERLTFYV